MKYEWHPRKGDLESLSVPVSLTIVLRPRCPSTSHKFLTFCIAVGEFQCILKETEYLRNWYLKNNCNVTVIKWHGSANFWISGTKGTSPGTRDTVSSFRDDPGHSGTVGNPNGTRPDQLWNRRNVFFPTQDKRAQLQAILEVGQVSERQLQTEISWWALLKHAT
jgi:hypothetical protein